MNIWQAEMLLLTAFPNADVHARYLDGGRKMGLGVQIGDRREGIRFNLGRHSIHAVITQLGDMLGQRPN